MPPYHKLTRISIAITADAGIRSIKKREFAEIYSLRKTAVILDTGNGTILIKKNLILLPLKQQTERTLIRPIEIWEIDKKELIMKSYKNIFALVAIITTISVTAGGYQTFVEEDFQDMTDTQSSRMNEEEEETEEADERTEDIIEIE